ncbi:transcriptional regulator [Mesorhizobium sp. J428]|uniref:transcriptional regulator n=1 Tax=Mesorhizobium sp. J428 TaxID=2898440 RepID=UPI002151E418|nr:transcriptional regulator [Mesorhizobium sp. J428]MCR5855963.1 transcriptional regulator [Mesorhizobium sp. J428]
MNRGPKKGLRPTGPSFLEKAAAAWGTLLPEWVAELARLADREGLSGAGRHIGYSASAVSTVIANKYRGDMGSVAGKVRGAVMSETVNCPVLGEIGRDRCLDWQKKPFAATSSHRVQMFKACRGGCPNARQKPDGGA